MMCAENLIRENINKIAEEIRTMEKDVGNFEQAEARYNCTIKKIEGIHAALDLLETPIKNYNLK